MVHLAYFKLVSVSLFVQFVLKLNTSIVAGEECAMNAMVARSAADFQFDLTGLSGVSFVGVKPLVTRVAGEGGEPMLTILGYSMESEPIVDVKDGKLVISHSSCPAIGDGAVEVVDVPSLASKPTSRWLLLYFPQAAYPSGECGASYPLYFFSLELPMHRH